MTDYEKSTKKRIFHFSAWCVPLLCVISVSTQANSSEETDSDDVGSNDVNEEETTSDKESIAEIRDKITTLIENDLAEAYSYTASSAHQLPHFEVIDRIFPQWHHGNPAAARQFWITADYRTFFVSYRVDYVYLINDAAAKVEGKRLVIWSENEDGPDLEKFWPFQLWAGLQKRTHRDNTYLSAAYAMRCKMKLSLNEKGEWTIVEETLHNTPEMINNIKNPCLYEKQLMDWGLRNDCNKKLLPQ